MSGELRSLVRAWGELVQKLGLFILLIAGSAAVGAAIAWPLWYFAISARRAYTAFALILAGCGIVYAVARSVTRRRRMPQEAAVRRASGLSNLLGLLQVLILLCGLYLAALLFYHGIWIFAVPLLLICVGLLVVLGLARRAVKASRRRGIMPKIRKE